MGLVHQFGLGLGISVEIVVWKVVGIKVGNSFRFDAGKVSESAFGRHLEPELGMCLESISQTLFLRFHSGHESRNERTSEQLQTSHDFTKFKT